MKYLHVNFRLLCSLVLAIHFGMACAAEIDMPTLMQLFSMNKNIRTEFSERKFVKILDEPVESKGELVFNAPAHLEKNTKLPRAESMTIDGSKVSIVRGTFNRTMSLDDLPDMASLVQSLVATFRGDQAGIEQYFNWTLTGSMKKWQLVLRPKSIRLFVRIREIRFVGENDYIHTVETTLTDGDSSLMTLGRAVKVDLK
jgi:outer membrane lipoprotein-sorting protein